MMLCSTNVFALAEIVSIGRTTQRYFGRNGNMISFASDEIVNVYGKGKSDKDELLVVEVSPFIPEKSGLYCQDRLVYRSKANGV